MSMLKKSMPPYEIKIGDEVISALPAVKFNLFWGKTLYHKNDIPFKISKIPLTSKAYRIPVARDAEPRETFNPPSKLNGMKN